MFGNFWESIWIVESWSLKLRLPDLYDHEVVPLYHHKRLQTLLGVTLILLMENLCTTQGVRKCCLPNIFITFSYTLSGAGFSINRVSYIYQKQKTWIEQNSLNNPSPFLRHPILPTCSRGQVLEVCHRQMEHCGDQPGQHQGIGFGSGIWVFGYPGKLVAAFSAPPRIGFGQWIDHATKLI